MRRINHHSIDNGDVEVHPLEFTFESTNKYDPYTDTNPTKSIDDDEMYHLLEFFHSEQDDDILDIDL